MRAAKCDGGAICRSSKVNCPRKAYTVWASKWISIDNRRSWVYFFLKQKADNFYRLYFTID